MIRIKRGISYADIVRRYKVFIDDTYCGDIKRNETKEFSVEKGHHSIYAEIDWCRSNTLIIEVNESVVDIEIGSSLAKGKSWIPFLGLIYITFKKNDYLWIKENDSF